MTRVILASTSPYRRELLARLRLPFETVAPRVDETPRPGEPAAALAPRLARAKAESALELIGRSGDAVILASDQTAALGNALLGKPGDPATALEQLEACQGKSVFFHTAVTIIDLRDGSAWHGADLTEVRFRQRDERMLRRYIEIEQPLNCAGGFKVEGLGIALFESVRSDDPTALIGLPLIWVSETLGKLGLDPLTG